MVYKILSLDGGGIRGLLTMTLIERIQVNYPNFLKNTELFAGTSIGGINALSLAIGKNPNEIAAIFSQGKTIFQKKISRSVSKLGGLVGAKYSNKNLKKTLVNMFGKYKLQDIQKKVLITSFETCNDETHENKKTWKPVFFHNFEGTDCDGEEFIVDVALATSAAPVYFPQAGQYIDGGVCCNNPSMAALCQVLDKRTKLNPRPKIKDIKLLSIGTGQVNQYIKGKFHDWGVLQWGKPILNILFEANSNIAHYQCKQILRNNYERLQPIYPNNLDIPLDRASKIPELIDFAYNVDISETLEWLRENNW